MRKFGELRDDDDRRRARAAAGPVPRALPLDDDQQLNDDLHKLAAYEHVNDDLFDDFVNDQQ